MPVREKNVLTRKLAAVRWLAIVVVAALLVILVLNSDQGRAKGTAVPLTNLLSILVCAFVAAVLTRCCWRAFPAPFVAGIAGSFGSLDPFCGPYGAATGLLIGSLVALLPHRFRLASQSRSAEDAD